MGSFKYYGDISDKQKMLFENQMYALEVYTKAARTFLSFDYVTENDIEFWVYGRGDQCIEIITEIPPRTYRDYTKTMGLLIANEFKKSSSLQDFGQRIDELCQRLERAREKNKNSAIWIVYKDSD